MWIKLLQRESIHDLLKPTLVNGKWRKPAISGRKKKELKTYFERAQVPWIYSENRPEIHASSSYNRAPKGTIWGNGYEQRVATIRKNLSTQNEKILKMRKERLTLKPATDDEATFIGVMKALRGEASGRVSKTSLKKSRTGEKDDTPQEEKRKGSPVKKVSGASKGGSLSKKEREIINKAKGLVDGKAEEEE